LEFLVVIADILWENETVGELSQSPSVDVPLAYFGYNDSTPVKEVYLGTSFGGIIPPLIFPINDTTLDVSLMAPIINNSFLTLFAQMGFINKFDFYSSNALKTEIYFQNLLDNYYFRASYYANNGTIKEMDAYYVITAGADPMAVNITLKRVFEFDITDEVEWGVGIGDTIYLHSYEPSSGYGLVKLDVQGFNEEIYWSSNWTVQGEEWPMTFQNLNVIIAFWDGTQWLPGSPQVITAANNFYPMCFPLWK